MSISNPKSQKDPVASIPIYFSNHLSSTKDILIGKVQLSDKNNFKVIQKKDAQNQPTKEYDLTNDSNNFFQYSGKESVQDSNYVLMKYNSKDNEIMMYSANNWVNFFKSMKKVEKKDVDPKMREKELKEKQKDTNKMMRKFFNFENETYVEEDKKKKRPKKKGIMANNEDDEGSSDSKKKKYLPEFKEDSHSSEIEQELGYDSFESEDEKEKKEEKKRKEEEAKKKKDKKVEEEEEEEEESEDDKDVNSDVSKDFNNFEEYFNLIGKKRERENNPSYELEERLETILRKKDRMTEDEIIIELKKVCKKEDIDKYFENVLDNITQNFMGDDGEKYYFLKK